MPETLLAEQQMGLLLVQNGVAKQSSSSSEACRTRPCPRPASYGSIVFSAVYWRNEKQREANQYEQERISL